MKFGGQVWLEVLTVIHCVLSCCTATSEVWWTSLVGSSDSFIVCSAAVLLLVKFGRQAALASRRSAIATMATAEEYEVVGMGGCSPAPPAYAYEWPPSPRAQQALPCKRGSVE